MVPSPDWLLLMNPVLVVFRSLPNTVALLVNGLVFLNTGALFVNGLVALNAVGLLVNGLVFPNIVALLVNALVVLFTDCAGDFWYIASCAFAKSLVQT